MPIDILQPLERLNPLEDYLIPELRPVLPRPVKVKILFLCEGLSFSRSDGFGFKLLIDLLRDNSAVKYANFELTLASWANNSANPVQKDSTPGTYQATYTNYRFSSLDPDDNNLILNKFDEVWLFGISPNGNFAVSAATILGSGMCPTQNDLVALTRWMNNGGGVLAMGDHASLGAHLCARIPRVWTMRRWTQEDGVPPRIGEDRVDTNQPMWASQNPAMTASPAEIPFEAQSDDVPQKIELKRYNTYGRFVRSWRPHPILCGGSLGMIDVLPDHPHEGWVNEDADINLNADIMLTSPPPDLDTKEYPTIGGIQPKPEVIAWGNTLPAPPHIQEKGASPVKRFGVIGAYDGQLVSLGRVVVDSTWHHWMSINQSGTYAPSTDGDPDVPGNQALVGLKEANNTAYKKIITYYRNVAIWLAPKARQQKMLAYVAFWGAMSTHTFEDWRLDTPVYLLGAEGKDVLGRSISSCFISRWVFDLIPERFIPIEPFPPFGNFDPKDPFGPICLTCPPFEDLENLALGVLLNKMMVFRDELLANPKKLSKMCSDDMDGNLISIFETARKEAAEIIQQRLEKEMKLMGKSAAR